MSHTNRNFIIAYTLLVALPVLGLIGVLKSGRSLSAPISVDGSWQIQVEPLQLASLPCGKALARSPETALVIAQSGRNFTVTLANGPTSTGSGAIDGTALKASILPSGDWTNEADCGAGHEFTLVATVDPKAESRRLAGTLSVNQCPTCAAVEFLAVRRTPAIKKESH